eukprot:m.31510 g.31510  ORF g.31510 m.31510 type:complete len:985 (-) comp8327_c0_seq1:1941-4895(-)
MMPGVLDSTGFPHVKIAVLFCRRRKESAWPKNGLPANYKDYGALYEVLLVPDKEASRTSKEVVWTVPIANTGENESPETIVSTAWPYLKPKRADLIDAVAVSGTQSALLYFAPVSNAAHVSTSSDSSFADSTKWDGAQWGLLSSVLDSMRALGRSNYKLSKEMRSFTASFDEWLCETHFLPQTVVTLWGTTPANRIKQRVVNKDRITAPPAPCARNPLYKSGLVLFKAGTSFEDLQGTYPDEYEAGAVRALAEAKKLRDSTRSVSPFGQIPSPEVEADIPSWSERFPLHRAAVLGDVEHLRSLIKAGHTPAFPDDDSWTPLHYAAWHGKTAVVRELMRDWQGGPIDTTDNGSTALHFAARNGYPEVVTILLACPIVKADAQDNDRQTPLMLCEKLQQGNWLEVAKILKNPRGQNAVNRFAGMKDFDVEGDYIFQDFRIFLLDGSEKVIRLPDTITARHLRDGIAGMLQIPEESYDLFAIWIASPTLTVQLEPDMQPMDRIKRWPKMAELYTVEEHWGDPALLIFKRNQLLSLQEERKTRSPVALKFLFDEALVNFLNSFWPCSVADSVFLAGLLMQIRYGDHDLKRHKPGFLSDGLETFVPSHLMHNQLRTSEWERRIYEAHKAHKGKTDLHLLHRLFLQYCWQWAFYGATFFEAELPKAKRTLVGAKQEFIRVGVTSDWLTIIMQDANVEKAAISVGTLSNEFNKQNPKIITIRCGDVSQIAGLQNHLRNGPGDTIVISSRQALLLHMLLQSINQKLKIEEEERGKKRMAQGGPKVLNQIIDNDHVETDKEERKLFLERHEKENTARYMLLTSFGEALVLPGGAKYAAQTLLENRPSCVDGYIPIEELNQVFMELGYWLGPQLESAREVLQGGGERKFNFRDIVSWWSQSPRSWMFLLDDAAFKIRVTATEIFMRNDPQRLGKVEGEKLTGVIRGLKSASLTKKTEQACRLGLDPHDFGSVHFNDYVDWLCQMRIIYDRVPPF